MTSSSHLPARPPRYTRPDGQPNRPESRRFAYITPGSFGSIRICATNDCNPATIPSDAAAQVDEPAMDDLTAAFEEIVYGGRTATEADDRASRQGWADLANTRSRRGRRVEVRR